MINRNDQHAPNALKPPRSDQPPPSTATHAPWLDDGDERYATVDGSEIHPVVLDQEHLEKLGEVELEALLKGCPWPSTAAYTYCSASWQRAHGARTVEIDLKACEARCDTDGSCLGMSYSVAEGGHCVLCKTSVETTSHRHWEFAVKPTITGKETKRCQPPSPPLPPSSSILFIQSIVPTHRFELACMDDTDATTPRPTSASPRSRVSRHPTPNSG